jgi:Protein of unknown function (DUF3300)
LFPSILRMMDSNLEWTERLGEAFLADPKEVMDAVQRLRRRAQSAGRLVSTPQEIVRTEEAITIEAPSPEIVYAPVCDPSVYGAWPYPAYPPYSFPAFFGGATAGGLGCGWVSWPIVAPIFVFNRLDFRKHRIDLDRDRFALLNKNRAPIGGEEWRHDPFHRGNVPYRDAALGARFGGPRPMPEIRPALPGYPMGLRPRIDRPFVARWPEERLVPGAEGPFVRRPVPAAPIQTGRVTRTLAPIGGGHYFSPAVGGRMRTPPPAVGSMQAPPFVGGMRAH